MNITNLIVGLPKSSALLQGLRDSITFGIPFVFFYLSIGILGASNSLTIQETMATTVFIFSTPLQFVLIQNFRDGWILLPIILAMNARFTLMSATLSPFLRDVPTLKTVVSSILVVPSVFTACVAYFKTGRQHPFHYFLGIGLPIYSVSIVCTYAGYAMGDEFAPSFVRPLSLFMVASMFTAFSAKQWPHYIEVGSYWAGFVLAPFSIYAFHDYNLLLAPFVIGTIAVSVENSIKKRGAK